MKKIFVLISLVFLVQIACGFSSTQVATQPAQSNTAIAADWTPTPDLTAGSIALRNPTIPGYFKIGITKL